MVVEESCSLVDLYAGIRDGTVEVPSASTSLSSFQRRSENSHFLSWWGASSQALLSQATSQLGLVKWLRLDMYISQVRGAAAQ